MSSRSRSLFKPIRRSSAKVINPRHERKFRWSRERSEAIITKGPGNTYHIPMDEIHQRLLRLRQYAQTPVKELPLDVDRDFKTLTEHISLIYDTEAYPTVHQQMENIYGDLKDNLIPGSIGAYIVGCNIASKKSSQPGCDILCAGSAPPPNVPGMSSFSFCSNMVLLAIMDKGVYNFTQLNAVEDKDNSNAIIYVQLTPAPVGAGTLPVGPGSVPWNGFSQDEINALTNYPPNSPTHIQNIKIIGYNPNTQEQMDLTAGFIPPSSIPSSQMRQVVLPSQVTTDQTPLGQSISTGKSSGSNWNIGLIIFLIILILIAIFVGYQCYKGRQGVVVVKE